MYTWKHTCRTGFVLVLFDRPRCCFIVINHGFVVAHKGLPFMTSSVCGRIDLLITIKEFLPQGKVV